MDDSMGNFKSCGNKGFQMTFKNGWTISVQWWRLRPDVDDMKTEFVDSETAEIAVWDADRTYLNISGDGVYVLAHRSPEEAARWIAAVADFKDVRPARKVKEN